MIDVIIVFSFLTFLIIRLLGSSTRHKGKVGERKVRRRLRPFIRHGFRVLNDVLLTGKDATVQIDHILITDAGIFVIETKNYKGIITGAENAPEWHQSFVRSRKSMPFENPLLQNRGHIEALKKLLGEIGTDIAYHSLAVFTSCDFLGVEAPGVVHVSELRKTIIMTPSSNLTGQQIRQIYSAIKAADRQSVRMRAKHVRDCKRKERKYRWKKNPKRFFFD